MDREADHLLAIAGDVAEGTPVEWDDHATAAARERDPEAVDALRDIERIVSAFRRVDRIYDTAPTQGSAPQPSGPPPDRWRHLVVVESIGTGSFGTVYRAFDSRLRIDVALKLLRPSSGAASSTADALLTEARLLARVDHENVVRVYGVDENERPAGLWMEFIKGQTLEQLLKAHGPFSAYEASLIGRDLCRALAAVHRVAVLHGDVKAHNVIREEGGRTVLADFGASDGLAEGVVDGETSRAGTPAYLAPEVLESGRRTASSDIYALGVLLYHLVTGTYPVTGRSRDELIAAHRRGERRHLRDERPDLPEAFVRIVERATAFEPGRRFASLGEFEDGLAAVTSPAASGSPRDIATQRTHTHVPRWLMGVAAAAAATVAVAWMLTADRSRPAQSAAVQVAPSASGSATEATYDVEAAFYRVRANQEERLQENSRIAVGDEIFLKFRASVPVNLYVVNEDERGEAFLEFPLPGQHPGNPLPAADAVVVPGSSRWQVTSAGEREHFIVFANPTPLDSFEDVFKSLPAPRDGVAPGGAPLPKKSMERLRGVGGLVPTQPHSGANDLFSASQRTPPALSRLFPAKLTNGLERARGLWVRQMTVENPVR